MKNIQNIMIKQILYELNLIESKIKNSILLNRVFIYTYHYLKFNFRFILNFTIISICKIFFLDIRFELLRKNNRKLIFNNKYLIKTYIFEFLKMNYIKN